MVFDVEVAMLAGPEPVMATAASARAWYSWLSPHLLDRSAPATVRGHSTHAAAHGHAVPHRVRARPPPFIMSAQMMRMPTERPRVLVGHNVSFDRARILDEYTIHGTPTRFLDTMSLHMAVAGLTSEQRGIWKKAMKSRDSEAAAANLAADADGYDFDATAAATAPSEAELMLLGSTSGSGGDADDPPWLDAGATNSLKDVYAFHCGGHIDKTARDIFFTGDLDSIQADIPDLLTYCATDVLRTHEVRHSLETAIRRRVCQPTWMWRR